MAETSISSSIIRNLPTLNRRNSAFTLWKKEKFVIPVNSMKKQRNKYRCRFTKDKRKLQCIFSRVNWSKPFPRENVERRQRKDRGNTMTRTRTLNRSGTENPRLVFDEIPLRKSRYHRIHKKVSSLNVKLKRRGDIDLRAKWVFGFGFVYMYFASSNRKWAFPGSRRLNGRNGQKVGIESPISLSKTLLLSHSKFAVCLVSWKSSIFFLLKNCFNFGVF